MLASTFWLLELWGIGATVQAAAAVNLLIGAAAWAVARHDGAVTAAPPPPEPAAAPGRQPARRAAAKVPKAPKAPPPAPEAAAPVTVIALKAPPWFVYLAAGVTGFTFFVTELVWFRMLAPLLGSSVYGFGLILALALAGIGLGGLLYRRGWAARPGAVSLGALALVAAWQALLLAAPWALGDRIAVLAVDLSQLRAFGLPGQVVGWTLVTSLLVVGPSLLAGVQFPLLVGLLGEGTRDAGRHVGYAYAANTLGAIAGSLAGGFVLLPVLTAPGGWRLVVALTLLLSLGAALVAARSTPRRLWLAVIALWLGAVWLVMVPVGPTAAWRHQPIGYGRVEALPTSINGLREWLYASRRNVSYEFEGREASVAVLVGNNGNASHVNGKSDGSAFGDADTQVMAGLLPAMLHPGPKSAFVVGLGTGSTAGWLADVPGLEQVDVAELESGMTRLARDHFAPVNREVMTKTNVRLITGDAREALLATGPRYDLIVSEPSNPYRAGVANLFTQEFYAAVKARLAPGGLFGQWLQGYEVDSRAVRLVYATLAAVFPYVETWITEPGDLLFISHLAPPAYSLEQLRTRVGQPPFAEALKRVWYTNSAEGVLARHLASPEVARRLTQAGPAPNTDDRNRLECGFARALAQDSTFDMGQILSMALALKADVPAHLADQVERTRLQRERLSMLASDGHGFEIPFEFQGDDRRRAEAVVAFVDGRYPEVLKAWVGEAVSPMEQLLLLESAARAGTVEQVRPLLGPVREDWPTDARFAAAQTAARHAAPEVAVEHLREGFAALRQQVWARPQAVEAALALVGPLASGSAERAQVFLEGLREPFPAGLGEQSRLNALVAIGPHLPPQRQAEVAALFEPYPIWMRDFLEFRREAYRATLDPRAERAEADLREFRRHADTRLDESPTPIP